MDIKRKPDEAYFPYKERLVVAKLEGEIDLDWSDIVELLGDGTHPDTLRKADYRIYSVRPQNMCIRVYFLKIVK